MLRARRRLLLRVRPGTSDQSLYSTINLVGEYISIRVRRALTCSLWTKNAQIRLKKLWKLK
jgi:hypothetical protein